MEDSIGNSKKSMKERIILRLTSMTSYIFPFVTTLPNLTWWIGIMTMPFFFYIIFFVSNPATYPIILPNLSNPAIIITSIIVVVTILYLLWSIIYLHQNKGHGLVTSGPYRLVRHPQYLSFIILTGIMTLQSVWILQHTFGFGWFTATETQIIWIGMLTCYALFAKLEERYLLTEYEEELVAYKNEVGYFIPGVKIKNDIIEILSGIAIPYVIFFIVLIVINYSGIVLF